MTCDVSLLTTRDALHGGFTGGPRKCYSGLEQRFCCFSAEGVGDKASRQGLQGLACFAKLGRRRAPTALGSVAGLLLLWKGMQLMQLPPALAHEEPATSTL